MSLVSDQLFEGKVHNTLFEDRNGWIWVGSSAGLHYFDGYDWRKYTLQMPIELSINGITQHDDGTMWLSTEKNGLVHLNLTTEEVIVFAPADHSGTPAHNIATAKLRWFESNVLAILTRAGFCLFDVNNSVYTACHIPYPDHLSDDQSYSGIQSYSGNHVRDLARDPDDPDLVWLVTALDVIGMDLSSGKIHETGYQFDNPGIDRAISPICMTRVDSTLFIGTWGAGIARFHLKSHQWSNATYEEYASSDLGLYNVVQELLTHGSFLYYAGIREVGRYSLQHTNSNLSPFYFNFVIDQPRNDIMYTELIVDHNGHLWTSSIAGVYRTEIAASSSDQKPVLALTQIKSDEGNLNHWHGMNDVVAIECQHNGSVELHFAVINPVYPENIRYYYRLSGVDSDWVDAGQSRVARYQQLRGGDYTFQVRAVTSGGSEQRRVLGNISVSTPIYLQPLPWLAVLALVLLVLFYLYRQKLQRVRLEERLKSEFAFKMTKMEMESLRSQMNPHFIFNSLNSIKNYVVNKGPDEAADYLTKFAQLIRVILENSKSDILTLEEELNALILYIEIENLRFKQKFTYTIDVDPEIDLTNQKIPPMLIQPHIENAIWHGLMHLKQPGKLTVRFLQEGKGVLCIIEDNGIGRKLAGELKSQRGHHKKSLGIKITDDRISMINQIYGTNVRTIIEDLVTRDGTPSGTRVKLFIDQINEQYA